ncbi:class II aldolase/adducin domain protein [Penicillium subrubescens]|jgi:ribulose-5-phosphate 4-epimerase/fuculose-1-phosphate aldolase|uniref:Meiotically up-regulated gene 14 protein n=1 Tax=Penicillium subrubescens TaxID=1316194 RepID=A0A1Q5URE7_9EURO|nr:class II aldolase/adducin domain protein [Penicillium subrubescens]KAJ5896984.1 class II aldolase/adducin domain protein [Penicillium subrubescens]OKP15058.1 Meiotically up-regulated gene 14 protein [Penicillium subrubescens]
MAPPTATETVSNIAVQAPQSSQTAGTEKAKVKMQMPSMPKFEDKMQEREYLKGRLAAAFRIFGKNGYDEGVAGHITLRDPVDPTTFWVNPFGTAFSLIKASDLIQVDHAGKVIDGGPNRLLNAAAFMIHSAIHAARPDVLCAAHSHSLYGRAFCSLGRPLDIISQDSCAFYDDHVVYKQFNGVVLAEEEGNNIAAALGNKKAALLQNHGLLTVGKSIEETVFWFVSLEKCCHAQLLADAAATGRGGQTVKIDDADAAFTYKTVGTPLAGWFSAKPLFDVIHKETNGDYLE